MTRSGDEVLYRHGASRGHMGNLTVHHLTTSISVPVERLFVGCCAPEDHGLLMVFDQFHVCLSYTRTW